MARHIRKGDMVIVTAGNDKDAVGEVLRVFPDKDRVIVQGVNVRTKHLKPTQARPQGGLLRRESPIHISNVQPIDGNGDATRIGRKWIEDPDTGRGRWIRYAKTTGEELDH